MKLERLKQINSIVIVSTVKAIKLAIQ